MDQHLVIIDGHHLMYRAFYAVPQTLKVRETGELTNVTYGVASMLMAILRLEQPTHLLFCFDKGEETFRHQENATYKDGRQETPDEFYTQIPRVMEFLDTAGLQKVADAQYEADDFLCVYARKAEAAGMRVTIVTGDRDALQIVTPNIRVAIPHKGYQEPEYLDPAGVLAKYGVRPDQVPSYKGLTGDSSDNLPGVKGIGPKTAAELLQNYDTLTGVYEHLNDIKESQRKKLEADREQAFFCERMATLLNDIPLPTELEQLALHDIPLDAILSFFSMLQFNTLGKRLQGIASSDYGKEHFLPSTINALKTVPTKAAKSEDQLSLF